MRHVLQINTINAYPNVWKCKKAFLNYNLCMSDPKHSPRRKDSAMSVKIVAHFVPLTGILTDLEPF
jgi:hypothetical protein